MQFVPKSAPLERGPFTLHFQFKSPGGPCGPTVLSCDTTGSLPSTPGTADYPHSLKHDTECEATVTPECPFEGRARQTEQLRALSAFGGHRAVLQMSGGQVQLNPRFPGCQHPLSPCPLLVLL